MCRSVANQTRCAQTVVSDFIDRANDFLDARMYKAIWSGQYGTDRLGFSSQR